MLDKSLIVCYNGYVRLTTLGYCLYNTFTFPARKGYIYTAFSRLNKGGYSNNTGGVCGTHGHIPIAFFKTDC